MYQYLYSDLKSMIQIYLLKLSSVKTNYDDNFKINKFIQIFRSSMNISK